MSAPLLEELCPVCDDGLTKDEAWLVRYAKRSAQLQYFMHPKKCPACGIDIATALRDAIAPGHVWETRPDGVRVLRRLHS